MNHSLSLGIIIFKLDHLICQKNLKKEIKKQNKKTKKTKKKRKKQKIHPPTPCTK